MKTALWVAALAWGLLAPPPAQAAPRLASPAAGGATAPVVPVAGAPVAVPYAVVPLVAGSPPAAPRPSPKDEALEAARLAQASVSRLEGEFDRLSREITADHARLASEITANHAAMMNCTEERRVVAELCAAEATRVAAGTAADPAFLRAQQKGYRAVQSRLQAMLLERSPTGPQVASHVYDLLGYAHYKLGDLSKALGAAKKALEYQESNDTARYNAASYCGRLRLGDACVLHLKRAIELDQDYRESARTDTDFDGVRADSAFQALVGP